MDVVGYKNDARFARLAELAGWKLSEAIGRVVILRGICVEMRTDTPGEVAFDTAIDGRAALLVRAHLAELTGNGGVRVLDVVMPSRGRAGGLARAAKAQRNEIGQLIGTVEVARETEPAMQSGTSEDVSLVQQERDASASLVRKSSETPAIASRASDLSPDSGSVSGSHLPDGSPLPPEPQTPARAVRALSPAQRQVAKLAHDAWEIARVEHARMRTRFDPSAIAWPVMPVGAGASDLLARIAQLLERGDVETALATVRRRIAVATAEAERDGSLRWFGPTRIWDDKQFWRAAEMTPEQVARRGAPARLRLTDIERERAIGVLDKLSAQSGVTYTGLDEHLQLIVGHLRRGVDHMDLRAVVAYCATELAWKDDPKMRNHLTPETLFGEGKIAKYLEPARAWYAKLPQDEPPSEPHVELDDQGDEPTDPEADS